MPRKSNTRAAQGSGSIRKRTVTRNGKSYTYWEARVTLGRDPGTGKQKQRSITGKTQKEVREKLQALSVELNNGTYTEPSKLTVGKWLDIWKAEYLKNLKPGSLNLYEKQIVNYIKPAMGAVKLDALTPHAVQSFYNSLLKENGTGGTLSPSSIRLTNAVFSSALKQAVKLGYIRNNPAELCTLPRNNKKEINPLNEDESRIFLQAIKGHPLEVLFTVDLFTGMREGEILGLTWDCVDFAAGTIMISKQLQRNPITKSYEFTTTKGGRPRVITPASWVMQLLRKHRARQAECKLLAGPMWENMNLVFTNATGRYLIDRVLYRQLKDIAEYIGRPDLRFHDLRHSFAVASLRAGDDIKTLQENLGHASASTTLNVYAHVTEQMRKASSQRMDAYIKMVMNG